jgi:hypothetical protein
MPMGAVVTVFCTQHSGGSLSGGEVTVGRLKLIDIDASRSGQRSLPSTAGQVDPARLAPAQLPIDSPPNAQKTAAGCPLRFVGVVYGRSIRS